MKALVLGGSAPVESVGCPAAPEPVDSALSLLGESRLLGFAYGPTANRRSEKGRAGPDAIGLAAEGELARSKSDPAGRAVLTALMPGRVDRREHPSAQLRLVLTGSYVELSGPAEFEVRIAQMCRYPIEHSHLGLAGERGALCLELQLADEDALPFVHSTDVAVPLFIAANEIALSLLAVDFVDDVDVECLISKLLGSDVEPDKPAGFPVRRILEELADEPRQTLADLSARVGRHPTHVARAFRQATHLSVGEYRRLLRLRNLSIDLKRDPAPLSELALRHGFSDQAHMSREFKKLAGHSPGAWRRRADGLQSERR